MCASTCVCHSLFVTRDHVGQPILSVYHLSYVLLTARCYAECGYATVCRPSVCHV